MGTFDPRAGGFVQTLLPGANDAAGVVRGPASILDGHAGDARYPRAPRAPDEGFVE
jgi:hypothetical protein